MRLFIDDVRAKPKDFDLHAFDGQTAIDAIASGKMTHVSFDHDLGEAPALTGYEVACAVEKMAYYNRIPRFTWSIHSANPVGRQNIAAAMGNAEKYWCEHERES